MLVNGRDTITKSRYPGPEFLVMPLITPSVITFYLSSFRYMDVANHQTVVMVAYGTTKDALELEMPTRVPSLNEANQWLAIISDAERVDSLVV